MNPKEKEKNKKAVALKYDPETDQAPTIIGNGRGKLAERILQIADEKGIPITEDQNLVEVLATLDLGEQIPPELYRVVAEVLSFIYLLD